MNAVAKREKETSQQERTFIAPNVNIFETKEGYVLEADLPGVSRDELDVTLEGNTLTLVGRRAWEQPRNSELVYRESRLADFKRVFELDPAIDTGKIAARMDQGVLRLELPKAEAVKPRKITVGE